MIFSPYYRIQLHMQSWAVPDDEGTIFRFLVGVRNQSSGAVSQEQGAFQHTQDYIPKY